MQARLTTPAPTFAKLLPVRTILSGPHLIWQVQEIVQVILITSPAKWSMKIHRSGVLTSYPSNGKVKVPRTHAAHVKEEIWKKRGRDDNYSFINPMSTHCSWISSMNTSMDIPVGQDRHYLSKWMKKVQRRKWRKQLQQRKNEPIIQWSSKIHICVIDGKVSSFLVKWECIIQTIYRYI